MEWIKTTDRLPDCGKNSFTIYLVVVEWLDTILDKDEKKSYVDVAYFDPFNKLFLSRPENTIIQDEDTTVTHWAELPEAP